MRIASLHVYPVKGCRGVDVTELAVEPWGVAGDRRWMVVDETGRYVSQRERPELARFTARLTQGGVEVGVEGVDVLAVKEPDPDQSPIVPVRVWGSGLHAVEAAADAHGWFSDLLGMRARLVWLDDPYRRPLHPVHGTPAAFSDGYPLLVTNQASLDGLNDWLVEAGEDPVPMNRFRPNLVVDGTTSWAEDGWTTLRTPTLELRATKPCGRCVVTTTDQRTGERSGRQPLLMLARRRRFGKDAVFGMNMAPTAPGSLRVGAPVIR